MYHCGWMGVNLGVFSLGVKIENNWVLSVKNTVLKNSTKCE